MSLNSGCRLLELPEAPLQHILQLADHRDMRFTCKQLMAATDSAVTHLSLAPTCEAHSSAALAAARWPHVTELSLRTWTISQGRTRAGDKQRLAELDKLHALLRAAAQHWQQLTSLAFSLDTHFDPVALEMAGSCLGGRLTSLTLGHSAGADSNAATAQLLTQHCSQLTKLHWGCGAVNDSIFERLGRLTALRQLVLAETYDPSENVNKYLSWNGSLGPNLAFCASMLPLSSLVVLTRLEVGAPGHDPPPRGGFMRSVADVGKAVACLTALKELSLQPAYLQEAAQLLFHVAPLTRLTSLKVGRAQESMTMDGVYQMFGVEPLQQHTALCVLEVPGAMLQDEDVRVLAKSPGLRRLVVEWLELSEACEGVVLPALEYLSLEECQRADVSFAALMPQLRELHCTGERWPIVHLGCLYGHPMLTQAWLGWDLAHALQAVTACLDSLPNFDKGLYSLFWEMAMFGPPGGP